MLGVWKLRSLESSDGAFEAFECFEGGLTGFEESFEAFEGLEKDFEAFGDSEGGFEGFEGPFVLALEGFEAFEGFEGGFEAFVLTFEAFEGFLPFGAPPPPPSTLGPSKASKASKVSSRKGPGNQPQFARTCADFKLAGAADQQAGNNKKQQQSAESCGCVSLQCLNKVFQHCGGPCPRQRFRALFNSPKTGAFGCCCHLELIHISNFSTLASCS